MATRFRLRQTTTAPTVSPALQSYTHNAPTTVRRQLLTSDSSALTTTAYTPDAADHGVAGDALWCQFVSDGMQADKTFTNGDAITLAMQGLEAHVNNNQSIQLFVSVVDSAGTTVQRTLRSKVAHASELGTALDSFVLSTTQDGATYTTVANDRLVVEISISGSPGGGGGVQGHNGSMRFGANGAGGDITADGETGTTLNPWFEVVPNVFSSDTTVTPSTASLTTSTFAPTVSATDNQLVTPDVASLTTSTFAPTVTASDHQTVTPDVASLTTTTFAPTVTTGGAGTTVTPDPASLTTSTFAPTVTASDHKSVTPTTASLTTSRFAPTVTATNHQTVTPSTASLATSTFAPTVTASDHKTVVPSTAALTLTTFAPTIGNGVTVTVPVASLTTSRFAPTVTTTQNVRVEPTTANLTLATFAATVLTPQQLTPATASLVTAMFAPTVSVAPAVAGPQPGFAYGATTGFGSSGSILGPGSSGSISPGGGSQGSVS